MSNCSCRWKQISITYSVCGFVVLVMQHAICILPAQSYIVICALSDFTTFSTDHINRTIFWGGGGCCVKVLLKIKTFVLNLFSKFYVKVSHYKKTSARYYCDYSQVFMWSSRLYSHILNKIKIFSKIFEKCLNTKFHENVSKHHDTSTHQEQRETRVTNPRQRQGKEHRKRRNRGGTWHLLPYTKLKWEDPRCKPRTGEEPSLWKMFDMCPV
jgi:hypothetical protein